MRSQSWLTRLLVALLLWPAVGAQVVAEAAAQSVQATQLAQFGHGYAVIMNSLVQLPDGRTFGFYRGGVNGAIFQLTPDGAAGGYQATVVYEFTAAQAGPPQGSGLEGRELRLVAPGADGKVYWTGKSLSRFDPNTSVVDDLEPMPPHWSGVPQNVSLHFGLDGHTLVGADLEGNIFIYDTQTAVFRHLATTHWGVTGAMAQSNGDITVIHDWFGDFVMRTLSPITGEETEGFDAFALGFPSAPVRGDDGEIYVIAGLHRAVNRVNLGFGLTMVADLFTSDAMSIAGVRSGRAYVGKNQEPHRVDITAAPPVIDRLATMPFERSQLLSDGTMLMFSDACQTATHALNVNTAVPEHTPTPPVVASADTCAWFPAQLTEAPDGAWYGVGGHSTKPYVYVHRVDGATGAISIVASLELPCADQCTHTSPMVPAPDGKLYALGNIGNAVYRFDPAANAIDLLEIPWRWWFWLKAGQDGKLYVAGEGAMLRIDPATWTTETFEFPFWPPGSFGAYGMVEASPDTWFLDFYTGCHALYRFELSTETLTLVKDFEPHTTGCNDSQYLRMQRGPDGMLYGNTNNGAWDDPLARGEFFKIDPVTGAYTTIRKYRFSDAVREFTGELMFAADGSAYSAYQRHDAAHNWPALDSGLARLDPATGAAMDLFTFPAGEHLGWYGLVRGGDGRFFGLVNSPPTLYALSVPDALPGLMSGDGYIRDDDVRYDFEFVVDENAEGAESGRFALTVTDTGQPRHGRKKLQPRHDSFVSTSYTLVWFGDDPTIRPGHHPRPQVDAVLFSGPGEWNGVAGYRFEAFAEDRGEPGGRDSLRVVIYDSAGGVVASVDAEITGGNVQSHGLDGSR